MLTSTYVLRIPPTICQTNWKFEQKYELGILEKNKLISDKEVKIWPVLQWLADSFHKGLSYKKDYYMVGLYKNITL